MYPATFPGEHATRPPIGAMPILPQLPMWRSRAIPSGVIIGYVSTNASVPSGWSRVASLDGQHVKQIPTSATAPGSTGGATTHTHPFGAHSSHTYSHNHSGSWATSLGASDGTTHNRTSGGVTIPSTTHTHTSSSTTNSGITVGSNATPANTDTSANDPLHVTTIFIQSNGTPYGVPLNGVVWYNAAAPAGFAAYGTLDNRLMKGAAAAADGGTQAGSDPVNHTHTSATHTHAINAHSHTVALDSFTADLGVNGPQFGSDVDAASHTHTLGTSSSDAAATSDAQSDTTGNGDGTPSWYKLRAVQPSVASHMVAGLICMWLGTLASIPYGWQLCDGTNSTPNLCQGKFVRAAAADGEVGNTGGAATHTHAAGAGHTHGSVGMSSHTHTFTGASSTSASGSASQTAGPFTTYDSGHNHASKTYTSPSATNLGTSTSQAAAQSANTSNNPAYTEVAYITNRFV